MRHPSLGVSSGRLPRLARTVASARLLAPSRIERHEALLQTNRGFTLRFGLVGSVVPSTPSPGALHDSPCPCHPVLLAAAGLVIMAALASLGPASASADACDVDCKVILCLPAGVPSGCRDGRPAHGRPAAARHGTAPTGACAPRDGRDCDADEIDDRIVPATRPGGRKCPAGKTLYLERTLRAGRISELRFSGRAHSGEKADAGTAPQSQYGAEAPGRGEVQCRRDASWFVQAP